MRPALADRNIVIAIYFHPEAFPPVLSLLDVLSRGGWKITVLYRPHLASAWDYPPGVRLVSSGKAMSARKQEAAFVGRKLLIFLAFTFNLLRQCRKEHPKWLSLHDPLSLFAGFLIRPLLKGAKPRLWYHSHDVSNIREVRKYTLTWLAKRFEKRIFRKLDMFTLPSADRLPYYPVHVLRGKSIVVPNYPSIARLGYLDPAQHVESLAIKILYQGRISNGHCLEAVISLLGEKINGRELCLTLVGPVEVNYKAALLNLADYYGVQEKLQILEPVPYTRLAAITSKHDIGLAVHEPLEVIYQTGGTASNKIYEYAAMGLPVILYDSPHYRQYLEGRKWAYFVSGSADSFLQVFRSMAPLLSEIGRKARADWASELNFEKVCQPLFTELNNV